MAELIIVLGVVSAATAGGIAAMQSHASDLAAKQQAAWLKSWGNEVQGYLVENYAVLSSAPITTTATFVRTIPGQPDLNVSMKWPTPEQLQIMGFGNKLPVTSPLGGRLRVVVVSETFAGQGPGGAAIATPKPSAFVYAENPVNASVELPVGPTVGLIRQQLGADSWAVLPTGSGGGTNPLLPPNIAAVQAEVFHRVGTVNVRPLDLVGYAGVLTGFRSSGWDSYVRRDGTLAMTGALDMATRDINNGGNVTANNMLGQTGTWANRIAVNTASGDNRGPNDNPIGWTGGVRTWDVAAGGSVAAVDDANREVDPADGLMKPKIKSVLDRFGNVLASGDVMASRDVAAGRDVTVGRNVEVVGNVSANDYYVRSIDRWVSELLNFNIVTYTLTATGSGQSQNVDARYCALASTVSFTFSYYDLDSLTCSVAPNGSNRWQLFAHGFDINNDSAASCGYVCIK